ncbi:uncharacterized protein PGTG_17597 [Puccinia graminis f. sp. tritici CRL 75-36-700-3]|uniref:Uncharacterized protein n=1 Tax=Puccinia graminis f. sp. tritici (strain CRL 75-36-700-3 / race SCCL) TaxID=418459 RepID=E3L4R8_PUCGT|nr:uncharacterized protein PGTG_17597 [Puccinia graminis f. sp. tritici CRL 75-36-700-3]EFP91543.1 hypothetical protein PGTG_17597 [Puccinia graminis f. sp. tritici CRL 75-36-700-3]
MSERHSRTSDSSRFDSPHTVSRMSKFSFSRIRLVVFVINLGPFSFWKVTKNLLVMLHPLAKEFEERFTSSVVPVKYREPYGVLLRKFGGCSTPSLSGSYTFCFFARGFDGGAPCFSLLWFAKSSERLYDFSHPYSFQ